MKRIEYMALHFASVEDFNRAGALGWEFVGDVRVLMPDEKDKTDTEQDALLFKRVVEES